MTEPHQTYDHAEETEDPSDDYRDGGRKLPDSDYKVVPGWPDSSVTLGQGKKAETNQGKSYIRYVCECNVTSFGLNLFQTYCFSQL